MRREFERVQLDLAGPRMIRLFSTNSATQSAILGHWCLVIGHIEDRQMGANLAPWTQFVCQ
jgi:hypothetical protein